MMKLRSPNETTRLKDVSGRPGHRRRGLLSAAATMLATAACCLGTAGLAAAASGTGHPAAPRHVATLGRASASCGGTHQNVMAYDNSGSGYFGNFAQVYVNTSSTIDSLHTFIFRSLFVYNYAQTSNVEFGWTAHNSVYSNAVPYSEYMVASTTQPPNFFGSQYPLNNGTHYRFRIENVGNIGIFRYYFEGQNTPIGYSPTMSFNSGYAVTNSEHYNTCDTLYTDMTGLQDMISNDTWFSYSKIARWCNSTTDWYLHDDTSSSDIYVNQTPDNWGGLGGC